MQSRGPPRGGDDRALKRHAPAPTIPAKRSADSRSYDHPSKRSTSAQEDAWVADEDRFVLQQAKKRAALRVKGGRAKPIDWLAVTLRFMDDTKSLWDDEVEDHELEVVDPEGVLEGLEEDELAELQKEIETYLTLETNRSNRDYWTALRTICKDRRRQSRPSARGTSVVAEDIDRLLAPKTYEELGKLENQVRDKLESDEPIDYDYWEQLLHTLRVFKAKAKLRRVTKEILKERLETLRKQQEKVAHDVQSRVQTMLDAAGTSNKDQSDKPKTSAVPYDPALDPQPLLKLKPEEKSLEQIDERDFLENLRKERQRILKLGYVPQQNLTQGVSADLPTKIGETSAYTLSRFAPVEKEDYSKATMALYEREAARGVEEGEEIFAGEEAITLAQPKWAGEHKPRKPRYFNRVQMGYEWNKYNQTHYDHDNPPPKVVQGYKFNIFYPDLIDKTRTPTYKIERENGRKPGESRAPAGEDDTCLIRFIAGPPYEDIAFRIVDKEWDYSAKRERGFTSTFDKGILQLHFQFKKIHYRK